VTIKAAIEAVEAGRESATVGFAHAARVPLSRLRETANDRWDLTADVSRIAGAGWLSAADVLEMRQGVTPGGVLELFLMTEERARELELEEELVHRAVKSKEVERWRLAWTGRAMFYPYHMRGGDSSPAFTIDLSEIEDEELARAVRRAGLADALDFDKLIDRREEEIARRKGVNQSTVGELLKHRVALGLVAYPKAAAYLVRHYERLEGRVFEKKRFTQMGKRWYEFHRPRDPKLMLAKTRIVSPTLMKHLRFSLDTSGYLSDHACLYLQPTKTTNRDYRRLHDQLAAAMGKRASLEDVLKYCLAFLNSDYAQHRFVTGRRPTPKGSYAMSEAVLREIPIAPPDARTAMKILDLVTQLTKATTETETKNLEKKLTQITSALLAA
jgi:hypothetical protein